MTDAVERGSDAEGGSSPPLSKEMEAEEITEEEHWIREDGKEEEVMHVVAELVAVVAVRLFVK